MAQQEVEDDIKVLAQECSDLMDALPKDQSFKLKSAVSSIHENTHTCIL